MGKTKLIAAMHLPPFHILGVLFHLSIPLGVGSPIALWLPSTDSLASPPMPTPESTMYAIKRAGCTSCAVVPAFLVAWAKNDHDVEYLKTMHYMVRSYQALQNPVLYIHRSVQFSGGGPIPQAVGDSLIQRGVRFVSAYGSTECCSPLRLTSDIRELHEWDWMEFDSALPIRFVEHPQGDGTLLYEFQMGVSYCLF